MPLRKALGKHHKPGGNPADEVRALVKSHFWYATWTYVQLIVLGVIAVQKVLQLFNGL